MNLFQKIKLLTEKQNSDRYVDISHHKQLDKLDENILKWVNSGQTPNNKLKMHQISNGQFLDDQHESLAKEHHENLNDTHQSAVKTYISGGISGGDKSGSAKVNHHLISAHKSKTEPNKHFKFGDKSELHLDHLDDAINANKLTKPLTTYSGVSFNPKDRTDKEHKLHMPAYTSSSTNRSVALNYAHSDGKTDRHIIKISHPKGSTGLYVGDNTKLSPYFQKEHISPRNMKLEINHEPEIHKDEHGNNVHIWSAKRIKD